MNGAVIVVNKRQPLPPGYSAVYCGRPSALGNPFRLAGEADRARVIDHYRIHLAEAMCGPTPESRAVWALVERVKAGENIALVCWCAPLACHADVIKREIDWCLQPTP